LHTPARQTWPIGHTTPSQGARHAPSWQTFPASHVTPAQPSSTHCPCTHICPAPHPNSTPPQLDVQRPRVQTSPNTHGLSSSTTPLQSLSSPSHTSRLGMSSGSHVPGIAPVLQPVTPCAHTPGLPVSQGSPPPAQRTPVKRNTLSLKSPSSGQLLSFAPSQSSHAK
jgi:hypothetical protein